MLLRRSHPATVLEMLAPQMPQLTIFGICILAILVWSHYYEISVVRGRATCKGDLELLPGWLDDWPLMLWPLACIAWSYHAPPTDQAEANYFIAVGTVVTWRCHVSPVKRVPVAIAASCLHCSPCVRTRTLSMTTVHSRS